MTSYIRGIYIEYEVQALVYIAPDINLKTARV